MFEFIVDAIRKSDAVVVSSVRRTSTASAGGSEYLRLDTQVVEAIKGSLAAGKEATIDIEMQGKETPQVEVGKEYLFFLTFQQGSAWRLVDMTRPVTIPEPERQAFLQNLRDWARIADAKPSEQALKEHVLKVLRSGLPFFVSDAAKFAQTIPMWTEQEVQALIGIASGEGGRPKPQGNDRDHLVSLVLQHGSQTRAVPFTREELKSANGDAVYYGLMKRGGTKSDPMLWELLEDRDNLVRMEAIRVAGLLRRTDILDQYEKRNAPIDDTAIRRAIEQARALAARD